MSFFENYLRFRLPVWRLPNAALACVLFATACSGQAADEGRVLETVVEESVSKTEELDSPARRIDFFFAKSGSLTDETGFATSDWTVTEHQELMSEHGINGATFFYKLSTPDNLRLPYEVPARLYLDRGYPLIMTLIIDDGKSTRGTSEGTATEDDEAEDVPGLLRRLVGYETLPPLSPDQLEQFNRWLNRIDLTEDAIEQLGPEPRYFDDELRRLAEEIEDDGRDVIIQPFHEANGGWYTWGMCHGNNSQVLMARAFIHVMDIFLKAGATNVGFVANLNRRGCDGVLEDASNYFDRIDQHPLLVAYSVSTYNRCGTAEQYPDERSFALEFGPVYDRLVELTDKPIWVAETSTSGQCGPRIPWFEQMLSDVVTKFPRTDRITFLMGDVKIGDASNFDAAIRWGFNGDEELLRQFRALIARYQR